MNAPITINQPALNLGKTAAAALARRMEEAELHEVRLVTMVDLPGYYATFDGDNYIPEELDAFVDNCWESPHRHPSVDQIMIAFEQFEDEPAEAMYTLKFEQLKPLFKFMRPVRSYHSANAWSSSWGHTRGIWIAANTFDEAWTMAIEWAQALNAKDLAKREGGAA